MADSRRVFGGLVLLTFLLMALIVLLSAHMRLSGAGLGCADWPACYGSTLAGFAPNRSGWVVTAHRIATSIMGFTVLAIAAFAWSRRRAMPGDVAYAMALLGLTAFLAVLGRWTQNVQLPAVALGNLLGGLGMMVLLWRMYLGYFPQPASPSQLRGRVVLGLILLSVQIILGGMVSANFAATSCASLSGCDGWLQHASLAAFNPLHVLSAAPGGAFVPGEVQQTLHMAHRCFALLVFCYLAWLGIRLFRESRRGSGMLLMAALVLQMASGIGAVAFSLPLFLVIMHNANAAFLLLILVTLRYRLRRQ